MVMVGNRYTVVRQATGGIFGRADRSFGANVGPSTVGHHDLAGSFMLKRDIGFRLWSHRNHHADHRAQHRYRVAHAAEVCTDGYEPEQ